MKTSEVDRQWHRIAIDIATATGQHLVLRLSPGERDPAWGQWWNGKAFLDGERADAFGTYFPSGGEAFVVNLAEHLQDHFSQSIWGGWPNCPDHNTHPLKPVLDEESIAVWKCPPGQIVAKIGDCPLARRNQLAPPTQLANWGSLSATG
jgi:hypothetical protein